MPLAPPFMRGRGEGKKQGTELMHHERPIEFGVSDTRFLWPYGRSVAFQIALAGLSIKPRFNISFRLSSARLIKRWQDGWMDV